VNNVIFATGYNGLLKTSVDGITWNNLNEGFVAEYEINSLTWNGNLGKFVLAFSYGSVFSSKDGSNWNIEPSTVQFSNLASFHFSQEVNLFLALNGSETDGLQGWYSSDLKVWKPTAIFRPSSEDWVWITFNNLDFTATKLGGNVVFFMSIYTRIYNSTDMGRSWQVANHAAHALLHSAAQNGIAIVQNSANGFMTSTQGKPFATVGLGVPQGSNCQLSWQVRPQHSLWLIRIVLTY